MQKKISPPVSVYKKIALAFVFLGIILILVIFYFSLTYAFIDINPVKKNVAKDFSFIVQENPSQEDLSRGVFSGKIVSSEAQEESQFTATGTKEVQVGAKGGKIKIINDYSKSQTLVATTRFLTADKVLFRLKDRVVVPAKSELDAEVYIDDQSIQTTVKAGDKLTIPGLWDVLQTYIYAQAAEDFTGNASSITVITQEDADNAVNKLIDQAKADATKDIANDAEQVKILTAEVANKTITPAVGANAQDFTVKLSLKINGVVFDKSKAESYAMSLLLASLSEDDELMTTDENNNYEIEKFDLDNRIAQVKGKKIGVAILRENSPALDKSKLVNLTAGEAKAYLENLDGVKSVDIKFFPFWTHRIPKFEDHIIIRINR